jgi:hypothetical protein
MIESPLSFYFSRRLCALQCTNIPIATAIPGGRKNRMQHLNEPANPSNAALMARH